MVVLWTANTERFSAVEVGINDTKENILASISRGEEEVRACRLRYRRLRCPVDQ